MLLYKSVYYIKADIMPCVCVFIAGVSQSNDQKFHLLYNKLFKDNNFNFAKAIKETKNPLLLKWVCYKDHYGYFFPFSFAAAGAAAAGAAAPAAGAAVPAAAGAAAPATGATEASSCFT